jgi:hypothetical protein
MPYRPRKAKTIHLADGVRAALRDAEGSALTADQIAHALGSRTLPDNGRPSALCHGCERHTTPTYHDGPVVRRWTGWDLGGTIRRLVYHGEVIAISNGHGANLYALDASADHYNLDDLEAQFTTDPYVPPETWDAATTEETDQP